ASASAPPPPRLSRARIGIIGSWIERRSRCTARRRVSQIAQRSHQSSSGVAFRPTDDYGDSEDPNDRIVPPRANDWLASRVQPATCAASIARAVGKGGKARLAVRAVPMPQGAVVDVVSRLATD